MAIEHAKSFVENFFENDEFIKEVIRERGFSKTEDNSEDAENNRMVNVANKMGFRFDVEEYKSACKDYMNGLGGWEATIRIFHMIRVATNVANEENY